MRAVWKGNISIGLVNVPVKIYSAVKSKKVHFKMLCKRHLLPIHYKMICESGEELGREDIVNGLEFEKGSYFIVEPEEIKKITPKKTDNLEICEFIDIKDLQPIYYENAYYVVPQKAKDKAFFLLKELMEEMNKASIGKIIMKNKEYLCALQPYKNGMILSILHFSEEINDIEELENLDEIPEISEKERELGRLLIEKYYNRSFDIKKYKDTFFEEIKKLIKKKMEGEEIKIEEEKEEKMSLMEALKASLEK
ncbi:MAG: Ku protein [Candidatus Thermoplasmatota archaeon]